MAHATTPEGGTAVLDPICGMAVDPTTAAARRTAGDQTLCFCSDRCVSAWDARQEVRLSEPPGERLST